MQFIGNDTCSEKSLGITIFWELCLQPSTSQSHAWTQRIRFELHPRGLLFLGCKALHYCLHHVNAHTGISLHLHQDRFMGDFKWKLILALGQYLPMATLETTGWVTHFVLEHVLHKFPKVNSSHITRSLVSAAHGISAITACGGAVPGSTQINMWLSRNS